MLKILQAPSERFGMFRGFMLLLVLFGVVYLPGCGRVEFNDSAYQSLCWGDGSRCVKYLNVSPAVQSYVSRATSPVDDSEVKDWESSVERIDGVFDFIGTADLSAAEKRTHLDYLLTQRELILQLHGVVDEELRAVAPAVLARNSVEQLGRMRIAAAPFLQRTNGSVSAVNGDQITLLLGTDRLAFNITDRGLNTTWVRSVVVHELTHVSHFASSTYATASRGDPPMERSLWVEGLATWGSVHEGLRTYTLEQVFGEDFGAKCRANGSQWARDYLSDLEDGANYDLWWRDNGQDPRGYGVRTPGYCVAYLMAAAGHVTRTFDDMLALEPHAAYGLARDLLTSVAR
jgi:hypothetical protein